MKKEEPTVGLSLVMFLCFAALMLISCNDGGQGATDSDLSGEQIPDVTSSLVFVRIPSGSFWMGCERNVALGDEDCERKYVTISRPLLVSTTEVTIAQWFEVMRQPPRQRACWDAAQGERLRTQMPERPVFCVDMADAMEFANALSRSQELQECYELANCATEMRNWCERMTFTDLDCSGYRLPTEAEWEYAARAGGDTSYLTEDPAALDEIAWSSTNSNMQVHAVGLLRPNAWGLYDMLGNVWEWTMDSYGPLDDLPATDPVNMTRFHENLDRSVQGDVVTRGGSAYFGPATISVSYRGVAGSSDEVGFRVVRSVSP